MRILFLTDNDLTNEVVYDIHMMAEALSLRRHEVTALDFSRRPTSPFAVSESRLARAFAGSTVRLITGGRLRLQKLGFLFGMILGFWLVGRLIRQKKYDAIVTYSVLYTALPALFFGWWFRIPVAFRNIDMLHRIAPEGLQRGTVKLFERFVYSRFRLLFALTSTYAGYLETLGARREVVRIVRFPLDLTVFRPGLALPGTAEAFGIAKHDDLVVFVGQLYQFSSIVQFVIHFQRIAHFAPEAKILVVGDGALRRELEQVVLDLGLTSRIILAGNQPFSIIPDLIRMAKVCINPYQKVPEMESLFSAKVVQYLACGRATVSSELAGLTSEIPRQGAGVVYVRTPLEMAEAVGQLLSDSAERERLGKEGRDFVESHHDVFEVAADLERHLERLIASPSTTVA